MLVEHFYSKPISAKSSGVKIITPLFTSAIDHLPLQFRIKHHAKFGRVANRTSFISAFSERSRFSPYSIEQTSKTRSPSSKSHVCRLFLRKEKRIVYSIQKQNQLIFRATFNFQRTSHITTSRTRSLQFHLTKQHLQTTSHQR
jgi:hypothetical protein